MKKLIIVIAVVIATIGLVFLGYNYYESGSLLPDQEKNLVKFSSGESEKNAPSEEGVASDKDRKEEVISEAIRESNRLLAESLSIEIFTELVDWKDAGNPLFDFKQFPENIIKLEEHAQGLEQLMSRDIELIYRLYTTMDSFVIKTMVAGESEFACIDLNAGGYPTIVKTEVNSFTDATDCAGKPIK